MSKSTNSNLQDHIEDIISLFQSGMFQTALDSASNLLSTFPDSAKLHNLVGAAQTQLGQLEKAMAAFQQSLALDPTSSSAHNNLGNALKELNLPSDALASYQKAASLEPDKFDAHFNSGIVTEQMGHHKEAIKHYEKALQLTPGAETALLNLANVQGYVGNRDAAAKYYRKILRSNPTNGYIHNNLSAIINYTRDDPHLRRMQQLLNEPGLPAEQKPGFGFALAKAYDDIGDIDNSFATLATANQNFRNLNPYDLSTDRQVFSAIENTYSVEQASHPAPEPTDPTQHIQILVVGMPRSGTSLVEQILASHSDVHGAGELYALRAALDPRLMPTPNGPGMTHAKPAAFRETYINALNQLQVQEKYIVDKMTLNFRWIGFILDAMPNARVLHIKRDPMATCWSNYKHYFTDGGLNFAFDLTDLGAYYRLYADLMAYWQETLGDRFLTIDYETLTKKQEPLTRQMLEFCGLDWQDQCLDFANTDRMVRSLSAGQVHQGLYQGSSEAWRKYDSHLGPLKAALGV